MDKPFKTYRQQLSLLRGRGLIINNGSKAMRILETDGYYNIINGYKDIFIDTILSQAANDDVYKKGTLFEHIYALYLFDKNIREIILKYCLLVETSLKSKIAYYFSEAHKQNFSYLDINNFDTSFPQNVTRLISTLSSVITEYTDPKKSNRQFFHYLNKHKELPLWVLVTKMSFGNTVHFYCNMKSNEKQKIVSSFVKSFEKGYKINLALSPQQQEVFVARMLKFLNSCRNYCAHQERLYNSTHRDKSGKPYAISLFHQSGNRQFRSKLVDCIIVLGLFLSKSEYKTLRYSIEHEFTQLQKVLPPLIFHLVLQQVGFTKNWQADLDLT